MRSIRSLVLGIATTMAVVGLVHPVDAAENGVLDYAPGAPGPFLGLFPPIPGLFFLNQAFFSPSSSLYGPDGKRSPLPISGGAHGVADRFIASYPGTFFGANLYQQLIVPIVDISTNTFGVHNNEFNVGNVIVSPFIMSWHIDPKQSFTFGFDIATQLSGYKSNKPLNIAVNYTSFQPVFVYRYFEPNGFTAGVGERLVFNTTNGDTQYKSGATSVTEFDIGYSFGNFRVGAVGAFTQQFEADQQFGLAVPGGNKFKFLNVGPSIVYNMGPVIINVNYQFGVLAKNTLKSDTLWINLAVPLYAAPPSEPPRTVAARY